MAQSSQAAYSAIVDDSDDDFLAQTHSRDTNGGQNPPSAGLCCKLLFLQVFERFQEVRENGKSLSFKYSQF